METVTFTPPTPATPVTTTHTTTPISTPVPVAPCTAPATTETPIIPWLTKIRDGEVSTKLNKVHSKVVNLFKVENTDPLTEVIITSMLASIANLPSNAVLPRSHVGDKMMVIHHTTSTGGSILAPTMEYFGLHGPNKLVTSLKFKPKAILVPNIVEVPNWDTLKKVTTTKEVESARDANMTPTFFTSYPPSFIAAALLPLTSPMVTETFLAVNESAVFSEDANEAGVPSTITTLKTPLPFL